MNDDIGKELTDLTKEAKAVDMTERAYVGARRLGMRRMVLGTAVVVALMGGGVAGAVSLLPTGSVSQPTDGGDDCATETPTDDQTDPTGGPYSDEPSSSTTDGGDNTVTPSDDPSDSGSELPTTTDEPSSSATDEPSQSDEPSCEPSDEPSSTEVPTDEPSSSSADEPSSSSTDEPSSSSSDEPSSSSSDEPTSTGEVTTDTP